MLRGIGAGALFHIMRAFAKSVLFGTIAAAGPMLAFTVLMAVALFIDESGERVWPFLWLAVLPIVFALPLVLGSSLLLGLPLTAILRRYDRESEAAYAIGGAAFGFVVPLAILVIVGAPAGHWTALLGAMGGAVTGRTWWRSARRPDTRDVPPPAERAPDRH